MATVLGAFCQPTPNFYYWQNKTPKDAIQKVARQVMASTPFTYRLIAEKSQEKFDFVKHIDFGRTFGQEPNSVAIGISEIISERDTTITMEISHNDAIIVWLNHEQVFTSLGAKKFSYKARERDFELMDRFSVHLKKGANRLAIKSTTYGSSWKVFLQPAGATVEFSEIKGLKLGLQEIKSIDPSVSKLSNWLIMGPFDGNAQPFEQIIGPEFEFVPGKIYPGKNGPITWTIPKVEIFTDVIDPNPLWGTLYNYNYHTAGLAWAMANLGEILKEKDFTAYAEKYCDFMLDAKPMADYQYHQLQGFRTVQHHLINTPLLDFTAAPTLPYVYFLSKKYQAKRKSEYEQQVSEIQKYLENDQVRLTDGTFTRETPEKYTTWVDDMFMGIPFLVYSGLASANEKEKMSWLEKAARQVIGFNAQVFDKKDNLYHHATYSKRPASIPYWSRANGWGIFATTIVLQHLPKTHPLYKPILATFKQHADRLAKLQDQSGFWHQILDDNTSYLETSGTAIFTMALARGVNEGWLPPQKYHSAIKKGWNAIASQIDENGDVYNICIGTMSSEDPNYYKTRPLVKSDSHGLIGVFWAAMEVQKWLDKQKAGQN